MFKFIKMKTQRQLKRITLLIYVVPFFIFSQIQIGEDIDGESERDAFGTQTCLSLDGSVLAASGPLAKNTNFDKVVGHVRVFENTGGVWTQIGNDIDDSSSIMYRGFGEALSLSSDGSILAVGAPRDLGTSVDLRGTVLFYENVGGTWTHMGEDLVGDAIADNFGTSVSLSSNGSIVAIAAPGNDVNGQNSGQVKIYENIGGTWTQIGDDIYGEAANDRIGLASRISISADGSIVAVGSGTNNGNGSNSGHVRVFENIDNVWTQIGENIDGEAAGDSSGNPSLSSDGSLLAIGATGNDANGINSGHVRVFENVDESWTQIGENINGGAEFDEFGNLVSLSSDGSVVAISAPFNSENGSFSGQVKIYKNMNNVWTQIGENINGEGAGDFSGVAGLSLSSDGTTVSIGAPGNMATGEEAGHVRVFDISDLILSANEVSLESIAIYPNPASKFLNIELNNSSTLEKVIIYNPIGQLISEKTKTKIDVSNYSKGFYLAEIITDKGKVVKRFIVE